MSRFVSRAFAVTLLAGAAATGAGAAEFTLMPSPSTVNIGNFNAANKPALTINSGDIVTLEAATQLEPEAIDASGAVPPSAVPQYVRDIYREVKDRGPGPHVLTGPIYVNGAMPGDVLGGAHPRRRSRGRLRLQPPAPLYRHAARRFHAVLAARHPARPREEDRRGGARRGGAARSSVLRHHGRRASGRDGPHRQRAARHPHRQSRQQGSGRRLHPLYAGACAGRAVLGRRRPRGAGARRSRSFGHRNRPCAGGSSSSSART